MIKKHSTASKSGNKQNNATTCMYICDSAFNVCVILGKSTQQTTADINSLS